MPDFNPGGRALWDAVTADHDDLDQVQLVQLTKACRMKDRLDKLDELLRGDVSAWASIESSDGGRPSVLVINSALDKANTTANTMKQLLAAMRLADATGRRPQQRGPRGSYGAQVAGGKESAKVSSLDRARARKGA